MQILVSGYNELLPNREKVYSIKAKGDFGTIIGINTIGIGLSSLEFKLKSETYDNTTLGIGYSSLNTFGVTYSQLEQGDYFVIYERVRELTPDWGCIK